MGCIGVLVMTVIWASPVLAVGAWIGYFTSGPQDSSTWLIWAVVFTVVALILGIYFLVKFRETKGASSFDLQVASSLPYEQRKQFLEEAKWKPIATEHISRGDGVGATFEVQKNYDTGKIRPYFQFDDGFEVTDDVLEWGRVTAIQFKADFDKRNGSI